MSGYCTDCGNTQCLCKEIEQQEKPASSCMVNSVVRLSNAITDACREIQACPDDSIQDIFNECLEKWETQLRMDHNFNLEPNASVSISGDEPEYAPGDC